MNHAAASRGRNPSRALTRCALFAAAALWLAATHADVPAAQPAVHPDVARALGYTVPVAPCQEPDIRRSTQNAGWMERNARASKRYIKCLERYQVTLFEDFVFLRDSVRHGVTMEQASAIAGNLGKVAEAIKLLKGRGVQLAQDQAQVISAGLSGNRTMPGAENR